MTIMSESIETMGIDYAGIVQRYAPVIRARCARELCPADADDACQAVFLVLWRKADIPPEGPRLTAWLLAVCRNVIRNAKRDIARRRRAERAVGEAGTMESTEEAQGEEAELRSLLAEELDRLPRAEREVVELHHLGGHTIREIAVSVGSKSSTVSDRLQRGMAKLRDALQRRGVALGLTALAGLLSVDAAEMPSPGLIDRIVASAPSAGSTAAATAGIPAHIIRWSRTGMSIMTRLLLICMIGALSITTAIFAADGNNEPVDRDQAALALQPAPGPASTDTRQSDEDSGSDQSAGLLVEIRLNDPARSWTRLLSSPYRALMPAALVQRGSRIAPHLGPIQLCCDPFSAMSQGLLDRMAGFDREVRSWPEEGTEAAIARAQEAFDLEPNVDREMQAMLGGFIDARGSIELRHPELFVIVPALLERFLPGDPLPIGALYHRSDETGTMRLWPEDGALLLASDSHVDERDWVPVPIRPTQPQLDLEIYVSPLLDAAMPSTEDSVQAHFRLNGDGLVYDVRSRRLKDIDDPADITGGSPPRLVRDDLARIPRDAMLVAAYRFDPAHIDEDPVFAGVSPTVKVVGFDSRRDASDKSTVGLELGFSQDGLQLNTSLRRLVPGIKPTLKAVHACFEHSDGLLLAYLRPGLLTPTFGVELACDGAIADGLLAALSAMEGVRADGVDLRFTLDLAEITVGYRDGRLLLTTDPQGLEALLSAKTGFTEVSDVQAVFAEESSLGNGLMVLRHAAFAQQVMPLLTAAKPDLGRRIGGMVDALPPGRASWLRLQGTGDGFDAHGEGALSPLLLPMLALLRMPMGVN